MPEKTLLYTLAERLIVTLAASKQTKRQKNKKSKKHVKTLNKTKTNKAKIKQHIRAQDQCVKSNIKKRTLGYFFTH